MSWISRLANAFRPERTAGALDEELRFHLDQQIDELVRGGMRQPDAERAARLKFGGALQVRESTHEVKSAAWLESLGADFRFGLRMLRKNPNATLAAIASLALAIGACTAAFAMLDALVFRPLPLPEPRELVLLARLMPGFLNPGNVAREADSFGYPQYELLRTTAAESADLFAVSLAGGFQPARFDDAGGATENVRFESISGDGFQILGVKPAIGRLIQPDDERNAIAVLSYSFWKRRFDASPSAIGRWVMVGGKSAQIVGVTGRGFSGLQPGYLTDLWVPLEPSKDANRSAGQIWGRLHAGVSATALQPRLHGAMSNFERERLRIHPPRNVGSEQIRQLAEAPLRVRDASRGRDSLFRLQFQTPLRIFALICVLLLLVACSNVGNLLIARAAARDVEMALRVSLGASRRRMMQQMLVESGQIAAAATVIAAMLAGIAAPALAARLGSSEFPAWIEVAIDARTIGFALGISVVTAILCGAVPAWRASSASPRPALTGSRVGALRWVLAAQVGFCVAVLFLSGLLLISFRKLTTVDLGFRRDQLTLFDLAPRARSASGAGVLDAARRIPGVQGAALAEQRPMGGDMAWIRMPFVRMPGAETEPARPREISVSSGFFSTLGIGWIAGRDFLPEELERDSASVIVNQAFVDRYLRGRSPLGQEFDKLDDRPEPVRHRIVGIAANSRWNNLREPEQATIYTPLREPSRATLLVRGGPASTWVRRTVESTAPDVMVRSSISLAAQIDNLTIRERLLAALAGFFSAVALLLAGVGLYGVIHFAAVRRTRELGIRIALGANRGSVVGLMLRDMSSPVFAGVAAGMAAGPALARYLTSQLFGVKPTDFWSFAAPALCILAAAIAATLPPAIRAASADPVAALRRE